MLGFKTNIKHRKWKNYLINLIKVKQDQNYQSGHDDNIRTTLTSVAVYSLFTPLCFRLLNTCPRVQVLFVVVLTETVSKKG